MQQERLIIAAAVVLVAIAWSSLAFTLMLKRTKVGAAADIIQSALTNVTGHVVVHVDIQLGGPHGEDVAAPE